MTRYIWILLCLCWVGTAYANSKPEHSYIGYSDYQVITDTSFDVSAYFRKMSSFGVNFQRIWAMGISGQIPTEIMPFARKGRLFDLSRINDRYIKRLHHVFRQAQQHDQQVMLTLFDEWSLKVEDVFFESPWYYKNSVQRMFKQSLPHFYNLSNKQNRKIQRNFVQTIVSETSEYHPIFELMNEPSFKESCDLISSWHDEVAGWILEIDPDARIAVNISRDCSKMADFEWVDVVTTHGRLWLEDGICDVINEYAINGRNVLIDTDGARRDRPDNRIVERWAKETLSCGGWFNHKDDIYNLDREALRAFLRVREGFSRR